jgi:hypothetical protein
MDWMEQEQERGITITSAATTCFWRDTASTSSTRPATSTSRPRSSGRCACSTARSRCSTRCRRRAAVRDGLAPGRQVPRAAHLLRQQDGPHRRGLQAHARADRDEAAGQPGRHPAADRRRGQVRRRRRPHPHEGDHATRTRRWAPTTSSARSRPTCWPRRRPTARSSSRRSARPTTSCSRSTCTARRSPRTRSRRRCASASSSRCAGDRRPVRAGHLRHGVQEQGRAAAARRGGRLPAVAARRPGHQGIDPTKAEEGRRRAQGGRRRAVLGAGVQDHDRPVRRPAHVHPRLLGRR